MDRLKSYNCLSSNFTGVHVSLVTVLDELGLVPRCSDKCHIYLHPYVACSNKAILWKTQHNLQSSCNNSALWTSCHNTCDGDIYVMAGYDVFWYDRIWHNLIWFHMIWCYMIMSRSIVRFDIVWHGRVRRSVNKLQCPPMCVVIDLPTRISSWHFQLSSSIDSVVFIMWEELFIIAKSYPDKW
jgi:hypothetical protein